MKNSISSRFADVFQKKKHLNRSKIAIFRAFSSIFPHPQRVRRVHTDVRTSAETLTQGQKFWAQKRVSAKVLTMSQHHFGSKNVPPLKKSEFPKWPKMSIESLIKNKPRLLGHFLRYGLEILRGGPTRQVLTPNSVKSWPHLRKHEIWTFSKNFF